MRVALVIQKLAGLRGGAERVVIDLAHALGRRGHTVSLVTYEPATAPPGYPIDGVALVDLFPRPVRAGLRRMGGTGGVGGVGAEGAERVVSSLGNAVPLSYLKWSATHGLFARRLASWLGSHPQDVVVGFLPPAISAAAFGGHRLGTARPRIIASTHNVPSEDFGPSGRWDQNPVARRRNLEALAAADVVTVLQPEFVTQLPAAAQERAVIVPNAVRRLAEASDRPREPAIIGVGRLTGVKRFDLLVEAFARIAADFPEWELAIFGDGPEHERLNELVGRTGLGGRVRIPGAVDDIAAVYDTARILVHPARFEGFGLSVAEAIVHGVLVLASRDCPGVNRLVEHGATGLLIEEGDDPVASFASGLRRLIERPPEETERQTAAEALALALSPSRVYDQWEQILAPG